jgi:hypothetical protein
MTTREHHPDDGPEPLPPAELLRLRAELSRPPGAQVRAQHLVAPAMEARQRGNTPMGRFASRSARAAVAIVAALAITSGLAGAQLLPDQAQRLLSNVSDRFAPTDGDPPADPAQPGDTTTVHSAPSADPGSDGDAPAGDSPTTTEGSVVDAALSTTTTTLHVATSTTIPGPGSAGSPDDPNDPDATTTTTIDPGSTTTTTDPGSTTTTTDPSSTTTTTTTGGGSP